MRRFRDRVEAGELLGEFLATEVGSMDDGIVLGLPRGGVPVAARVAAKLDLPLDVFIVRKLGMPGHEEYAMGAIASGGVMVLNEQAVRGAGINEAAIQSVADRELVELERRERLYRGDRPPLELATRNVILVDDGIATGSSVRAAIEAIRMQKASSVTVAVPVAPRSAERDIGPLVDRYVALRTPTPFSAVGWWYENFTQTSDDEVRSLLTDL
jgi:putative phosphoribosyl transferase